MTHNITRTLESLEEARRRYSRAVSDLESIEQHTGQMVLLNPGIELDLSHNHEQAQELRQDIEMYKDDFQKAKDILLQQVKALAL